MSDTRVLIEGDNLALLLEHVFVVADFSSRAVVTVEREEEMPSSSSDSRRSTK
jgi:hypothetical protein